MELYIPILWLTYANTTCLILKTPTNLGWCKDTPDTGHKLRKLISLWKIKTCAKTNNPTRKQTNLYGIWNLNKMMIIIIIIVLHHHCRYVFLHVRGLDGFHDCLILLFSILCLIYYTNIYNLRINYADAFDFENIINFSQYFIVYVSVYDSDQYYYWENFFVDISVGKFVDIYRYPCLCTFKHQFNLTFQML